MAASARIAASTFTVRARKANETAPSTNPNRKACSGVTWWRGRGRCRVRRMIWSMSRSRYMLIALAEPAASVPPIKVASISQTDGTPAAASIIAGTVVMRSSTMMRGFVSAR